MTNDELNMMANMSNDELLRYIDRVDPVVRELATRLEICLDGPPEPIKDAHRKDIQGLVGLPGNLKFQAE